MLEFRRSTHWWFWGCALLVGALTVPPFVALGAPLRRLPDLLQPGLWIVLAVLHRRSGVRLSEREIASREFSGVESAVALDDLRELRWENSGAICFGTGSGGFYTLSLSGLGWGAREEIRDWLRENVEAYRASTKRPPRAAV